MTLKARVIRRFAVGSVFLAALLFLPAGSLRYWQGWLFIGVAMGISFPGSLYLLKRDPQLMERRLRTYEKEKKQQIFKLLAGPFAFAALIVAGLDFRFGWTRKWIGPIPVAGVLIAAVVLCAGYALAFWAMIANSFAGRTIRVEAGQTVISTGPYAIVRHPMYSGLVLLIVAAPFTLASFVALLLCIWLIPVLMVRLLDEETFLRRELAGYAEYCNHTRFRLVPHVW